MIRNLKTLGVALAAMLAMGAVAASGASAQDLFTSNEAAALEGTQTNTHVFEADTRAIECTEATFTGSGGTEETSLIMEATYDGCEFAGVNVDVDMGNCAYEFHASGTVDVINNGGEHTCTHSESSGPEEGKDPISFTASFFGSECTVEVGAQTGLESVSYSPENEGTEEISAEAKVNGIEYRSHGSLCNHERTAADGVYNGNADIVGNNGNAVLTVDTE